MSPEYKQYCQKWLDSLHFKYIIFLENLISNIKDYENRNKNPIPVNLKLLNVQIADFQEKKNFEFSKISQKNLFNKIFISNFLESEN